MNPFYNPMQAPQQSQGPFGNIMNMVQQFNQFRNSFQGDPRQKVQELLQSGQMSQEQFNNLSNMANQFRQFLH